jgi:hypothetical protein
MYTYTFLHCSGVTPSVNWDGCVWPAKAHGSVTLALTCRQGRAGFEALKAVPYEDSTNE